MIHLDLISICHKQEQSESKLKTKAVGPVGSICVSISIQRRANPANTLPVTVWCIAAEAR